MTQTANPKLRANAQPQTRVVRRTRRIVNVRLLVVSTLLAGVFAAGGYVWYCHQTTKVAATLLQRATALEAEGKLAEAGGYFARYLQLEPADADARVRLIAAFEQSATSRPGKERLSSLLYQTIGTLPERHDLRLKLAQTLYDLGYFADAQKQAEVLAQKRRTSADGPKTSLDPLKAISDAADRIVALSMHAQARPGGVVTISDASAALGKCLENDPGDAQIAALTAAIYREHSADVGPQHTFEEADQIMDQLVAIAPKNVDALIARYLYGLKYHPDRGRADLDAALAIAPENVIALLLDVESAVESGDKSRLPAAAKSAQKIIKQSPDDPRGYLALAKVCVADGNSKQAIATLQDARKKLSAPSLDTLYMLAALLLDANDIDACNGVIQEFADAARQALPLQEKAGRTKIENMNRLLSGKLALARHKNDEAVPLLEAIVATTDQIGDVNESAESMIASDLLANINAQLGRPDVAAAYWAAVADRSPGFAQAGWKAGIANLELGRTDTAISQLTSYLKVPGAAPEARLSLLEAQLRSQLARPANARSWTNFQQTLAVVRLTMPDRYEWKLAEIVYLASLATDNARADAKQRIVALESQAEKDETLCERLIAICLQIRDVSSAERLLATYDKFDEKSSRRAIARASVLAASNRVQQSLDLLEGAAAKAPPEEQFELANTRLKLLLLTRQWDQAQNLVSKLITGNSHDPRLLVSGIEIALRRQDFQTAKTLAEKLQKLPEASDFDRRFYRASVLVATFADTDAAAREEAQSLVESLLSERPNWPPVVTLSGQLAQAQGRSADAISIYQSALKMGDQRSETVEGLVRLLYAAGRFSEAGEYLAQLGSGGAAADQVESLAIAAAVQGNRIDEARSMTEEAVKRGSKDPAHYILLASLQHTAGNKEQAESTLRTAIQRFPKDGRVWNAVFLYFLQVGEQDRAKQSLERWAEQVSKSESEKFLILGQGREALGDATAAQAYYRQAVEKNSEDVTARFLLAKSLASDDLNEAIRELDTVLAKSPNHAEARRLQAALLATTGNADDWAKSLSLLKSDGKGAAGDERLHAILLTRKGKDQQERKDNYRLAREILSKRVESGSDASTDIDRMLLSGICEQEAKLTKEFRLIPVAREALRPVADRTNVTANQLLSYVQFLLRHVASENPSEDSETSATRQLFAEDAAARINSLEQLLAKEPKSADQSLLPLALRMKLLQAEGKSAEGTALLGKYVESQLAAAKSETDRGKLMLQAGKLCASVGEFSAAETWFRRLEKIAPQSYILVAQSLVEQQKPQDAVRLCLQVMGDRPNSEGATAIAQFMTQLTADPSRATKVDPDLKQRALRAIDDALDADRGNLNLLMSSAVLQAALNENEEAVQLFRRVVEIEPRHSLALNNLATLLSEQPDRLEEAQQFIERAITVSGRQPALLDTLGTILLRAGKYKRAIEVLEEAVAGSANDPRYYFHLAAAYDGDGQTAIAEEKLKIALGLGLEKTILTSGDRALLTSLKKQTLSQN